MRPARRGRAERSRRVNAVIIYRFFRSSTGAVSSWRIVARNVRLFMERLFERGDHDFLAIELELARFNDVEAPTFNA